MEPFEARKIVPFPGDEVANTLSVEIEDVETLNQAFKKFSDASILLQSKYDELKNESAILRGELLKKEKEIKRSERLATLGETAAALAQCC